MVPDVSPRFFGSASSSCRRRGKTARQFSPRREGWDYRVEKECREGMATAEQVRSLAEPASSHVSADADEELQRAGRAWGSFAHRNQGRYAASRTHRLLSRRLWGRPTNSSCGLGVPTRSSKRGTLPQRSRCHGHPRVPKGRGTRADRTVPRNLRGSEWVAPE